MQTVECRVYDDKSVLLTSNSWDCSQGKGDINKIAPGPGRQFVILGIDAEKDIVYQGKTLEGLTMAPGKKTIVPTIDAYPFMPSEETGVSVSDTQIDISWTPSNEQSNIAGYRIHCNGHLLIETPSTSYSHQTLTASMTHCYDVSAYDHFGNTSKAREIPCTGSSNRISDTAQATSYTDTHGEDADYDIFTPAYTKLDATGNPLETAAANWTTVRDNVTGLVWEVKTTTGDIQNRSTSYTWGDAKDTFITQLKSSNFGGYDDWRLPNIKEMASIVADNNDSPSIDTVKFPNTQRNPYWSSTTALRDENRAIAMVVDFSDGFEIAGRNKTAENYLRAVCDAQP